MSLYIGEYLHIYVLEYLFDIPIFRYFFYFGSFFPGACPLFKGGLGPILQLDPPFYGQYVATYPQGAKFAITPKIILGGDYTLKKCDAVLHNI